VLDPQPQHWTRSVLFLAGALLLYALIHQTRFDKDSLVFLKWYREGQLCYYHPLYLPLMTGFARVLELVGVPWMEAVRLYSCVCGAVAVLFVHRLALAASGRVGYADLAVGLFALSPAVVYFSSIAELNMGGLALLCAAVWATDRAAAGGARTAGEILRASWLPAVLLGLSCAHHTPNTLCWPGVVLLHLVRAREGRWRRTLWFAGISAVAVGLLSRVLPVVVFGILGKTQESEFGVSLVVSILARPRWFAMAAYVADQLVFFSLWILPLGLLGALARGPLLHLSALLATALPAVVIFGAWDRADTGAYYLPLYPFLLWYGGGLAASATRAGATWLRALGVLLVLSQGALTAAFLLDHHRVDHERQWREGLLEALAERGVEPRNAVVLLFGFQRSLDLDLFAPDVPHHEMLFYKDREVLYHEDAVAKYVAPAVAADLAAGHTLVLDAEAIQEEGRIRAPGLGWFANNTAPGDVLKDTRILAWLHERFEFVPVAKKGFRGFWLVPRK
jgi:hypothetical protein